MHTHPVCVWRFDIFFFHSSLLGLRCGLPSDAVLSSKLHTFSRCLTWSFDFVLVFRPFLMPYFFASLKPLFSFFHAPFITSTYKHVHTNARAHIQWIKSIRRGREHRVRLEWRMVVNASEHLHPYHSDTFRLQRWRSVSLALAHAPSFLHCHRDAHSTP